MVASVKSLRKILRYECHKSKKSRGFARLCKLAKRQSSKRRRQCLKNNKDFTYEHYYKTFLDYV